MTRTRQQYEDAARKRAHRVYVDLFDIDKDRQRRWCRLRAGAATAAVSLAALALYALVVLS